MNHKKLVIVESPNKVQTIKKYLGKGYDVEASVGHIMVLAKSGVMKLGIDLEKWEPRYIIDKTKQKIVTELKKLAKNASEVYIATDPDREGEAISDHLVKELNIEDKYKRIRYNEITKEAILKAIEHPKQIDQALVDAQKARRMLDRIIGFRLSNLVNTKLKNAPTHPSAGRVQSIALKLIVDREKEIEAFVPVGYRKVTAVIDNENTASIYMENHPSEERDWVYLDEIEAVKAQLSKMPTNQMVVTDIKNQERKVTAITPLKQATLYRKSPFSSLITQSTAQKLYEGFGDGGLISYPRTDSTRLSETFVQEAQKYIQAKYGSDFVAQNIKGVAGDQDAHEAIRPTDIHLTPLMAKEKFDLNNYEFEIYKLIYENTLQALIKQPIRATKTYTFEKHDLTFKMTISRVVFPGYYVVKAPEQDLLDPNYELNQIIDVERFVVSEHETKPPARYTEGSLIEKLDEIKVGRPSTFASTVKIVLDREYAENKNGALQPTEFGKMVLEKLIEGFPTIINESYTAKVEEDLDKIAENRAMVPELMEDFYQKFTNAYEQAQQLMQKSEVPLNTIDELCPDDGGTLMIKNGKFGKFIGCANFPNCKFTKNVPNAKKPFTKRFFDFNTPKNNEKI
ncbi:type I DNA topoisomerase [Mycoplasmopsis columbinasalis]|uniref:DNA topoisomerase 1 n=1 Tax=Mycoplasmopsis columbinasalis TaxID=114880 RepID=A0A449BAS4_9BACT|nr:type I DNA topoisomerase [Mycoplasmopsis columbinasalis]VEU78294.1 DNA topoisomerase 1 [Mycoplasmopsis columbinasalis]